MPTKKIKQVYDAVQGFFDALGDGIVDFATAIVGGSIFGLSALVLLIFLIFGNLSTGGGIGLGMLMVFGLGLVIRSVANGK